MSALRRISTRRLLAICAVTVAAAIGVTAVAMATGGGGPKPPPKPLANAVHDALSGPTLPGISARIQFTNNLVDASSIQGTDPLLSGATRPPLGLARGRRQAAPRAAVRNGAAATPRCSSPTTSFEIYDGGSETVYKGTLPEEGKDGKDAGAGSEVPGLGEIETKITEAEEHAELSGAIPSDVAGQPTYTLHVAPKHDGGLLGGAEVAWDASNGSAAARRDLLELVELAGPAAGGDRRLLRSRLLLGLRSLAAAGREGGQPQSAGRRQAAARSRPSRSGVDAVQKSLDFPLDRAGDRWPGLPRNEVRSIEVDGQTAALATYGKGLGGIAVIESAERTRRRTGRLGRRKRPQPAEGLDQRRQGEELDTALGTVLRFSRGGVDYIVAGSVPPAAAEAAARAL